MPAASPPSAHDGTDTALARAIDLVTDDAIASGRLVGAVVMVSIDGRVAYARAKGHADREAGRPMTLDSRFRLASMTKPLVTATALRLARLGKLSLDAQVSQYLPYFQPALADGSVPPITVGQLMLHLAGLDYRSSQPADGAYRRLGISDGTDQPGLTVTQNLQRLAAAPLLHAPGSCWTYSLAIDVLGGVMEAAMNDRLNAIVRQYLTGSLGMMDTDFLPGDPARLVTPYVNGTDGPIPLEDDVDVDLGEWGVEHFAPSRLFDPASYHSGGSGMVGTAGDYIRFLEALRTGGGGTLASADVDDMLRPQLPAAVGSPAPGWNFSYGFGILETPWAQGAEETPQSIGTVRWAGIYGNNCFMDPARAISVVALSNTMPEGVTGRFPIELRDAVYRSLPRHAQ